MRTEGRRWLLSAALTLLLLTVVGYVAVRLRAGESWRFQPASSSSSAIGSASLTTIAK